MKILLVEDDLEISKLLVEFLQENGYEVFCQYDGLHVLDCLRENKIDLILLDIMFPYRNGDTVLTAVRECSTVPIIVISAKGTTQKALLVLEEKLHTENFKLLPDGTIRLYDYLDDLEKVAAVLSDEHILVTGLSVSGDTLEDYFLSKIGGSENVKSPKC